MTPGLGNEVGGLGFKHIGVSMRRMIYSEAETIVPYSDLNLKYPDSTAL